MLVNIQAKLKGQVADDYSFLKNHFGTETETDTIRVIIRELARMVKEQLPLNGKPSEPAEGCT